MAERVSTMPRSIGQTSAQRQQKRRERAAQREQEREARREIKRQERAARREQKKLECQDPSNAIAAAGH
jgi:hypothetical protein